MISGLASLAGVPASIVVAELATKWNRSRVIIATCVVSVAVCLALAATAGGAIAIVLTLLILLQVTSFADVSALGVGAVMVSDPARRGAALAVYALAGFTTGFLGPAAIIKVQDIGDIVANSIIEFFSGDKIVENITELLQLGVNPIYEESQVVENLFMNKTIVVTGSLESYSREEIKDKLEGLGAKVAGTVSKKQITC